MGDEGVDGHGFEAFAVGPFDRFGKLTAGRPEVVSWVEPLRGGEEGHGLLDGG